MFELQQRKEPSRTMVWVTPILAVILTMLAGSVLFAALGKDPVEVVRLIFVQPLLDPFSRTELLVKGTPLVLIAIGLSFGFRAGVWNIGAEGQFIIGAIAGGAVGLAFYDVPGFWLLPLMALAGAAAGAAWAMIPAVLRIKFNANENSGLADAGLCGGASAFCPCFRPAAGSGRVQLPGKPPVP